MKTGKEYIESIRAMNFELYINGGKINNVCNHPKTRPAIEAVAETYDLAFKRDLQEQFLTKSHLTGETISRFQHVPQSTDDRLLFLPMRPEYICPVALYHPEDR
jgi:4-hydroxybutyryl-CoA dehydratase/vinylacetyl-CoA-Delta-isomerase